MISGTKLDDGYRAVESDQARAKPSWKTSVSTP